MPFKLKLYDEVATDDVGKSNLFGKFFSSVYDNHPHDHELDNFIANKKEANTYVIHSDQWTLIKVLAWIAYDQYFKGNVQNDWRSHIIDH